MSEPIILVDGSSIGFASTHRAAKLSAGDIETTAVFGFLIMLRRIKERFPGRVIVLWDGRSWRHDVFSGYKGSRDKYPELVAIRQRWKEQRQFVVRALPFIGVEQVRAGNMEADDLAATLSSHYASQERDVVLVSGDADWQQLVGPRIVFFDPIRDKFITRDNFKDVVGLPSPYSLAQFKALTGDSDDIPGVGGIGAVTAKTILNGFGTVEAFVNVCLTDRDEYERADRRARLIVDDEERRFTFQSNMKLIWLHTPDRPKMQNVAHVKPNFNVGEFATFCGELAFTSILRDLPNWLEPFARKD